MEGKIEENNDSTIITEIVNKSFITVANEFDYTIKNAPMFPAFIKKDIIEKQILKGLKMYVYKVGNKIIGSIGYSFKNNKYTIERLSVLPEYRHKNIGKTLMVIIENKIKEKNGLSVKVEIVNNNIRLKEWYKKLGYKEVEVQEFNHLPFKVGIMEKEI